MFNRFMKINFAILAAAGRIMLYASERIPEKMHFIQGQEISIESLPIVSLSRSDDEDESRYTANLFGIVPVKDVAVTRSQERYVNVSGKPFGIKMFCDGVMVVGFSDILTATGYRNPAKAAGLKTADIITHINNRSVQTNEDVERMIEKHSDLPIKITYIRENTTHTALLTAVKDINTQTCRTGMWVRDSGAGIGTMTFFDLEKGSFAGLGHGIKDVDTQKELRLLSGEIVPVKITGIVKSKNGSAGQLKGSFTTTVPSGKVLANGETGVYGKVYLPDRDNVMPVASPASIKPGKAYMLTTINGNSPKMYEVEIEKVNLTATDRNKNMVIRVTDSRLLTLTGGIVAGMSGSPIIQDGRLAGAVTHVFVNNVEKGYAIFAQNMVETLDKTVISNDSAA